MRTILKVYLRFDMQTIVSSQHYPNFLETAIPIFVQLLKDGMCQLWKVGCV